MHIFQNEFSFLNEFFRSTPCTIPIILFAIYFANKNMFIFYLILGWFFMDYIGVGIFKNIICKPIGDYITSNYGIIDFPIIGRFKRPDGAKNCGCFYVSETNYATSEGMPSGHSILVGFVAVFMYNYIIDEYNINHKYKPYIFILTFLFILYTMYSRVLINCHTTQQTILGALIGSLCGYYYYKYVSHNNKKINNKTNNKTKNK